MALNPYYADDTVTLYVGDMREVLPALDVTADLMLADPPYQCTPLPWDRWPDGWLEVAATVASSLWCFGSLRMFGERWGEFGAAGWKLSQDLETEPVDHITWEKHNGSGFAADRFKRVHETATHWYRGDWRNVSHDTPRERGNPQKRTGPGGSANRTTHAGAIGAKSYIDDGTRLLRSVIRVRSMQNLGALHPTQKPSGIIQPLLEYACPLGGLVVDPFAGSGSTLMTARMCGRQAIGVEANEAYAEKAALWLSQLTLEAS